MTYIYRVLGLHCPSCQILIEDKLSQINGIKSVNVDLSQNQITIDSQKPILPSRLNQLFSKNGYQFLVIDSDDDSDTISLTDGKFWWLWAIFAIAVFLVLSQVGFGGFLNINNDSSLIAFFVFGLVAGFSSCGALLSGLILSSPQSTKTILLGRIIAYSILGGVLGLVGRQLAISYTLTSVLMILVSIVMVIIGLQMLEVKFARRINLFLPKTLGKKITHTKLPFVVGLLTVFLPCGFTLLTESVAILSGSFIRGLLVMFVFVLGTSFPLFLIGLSGNKLIKNQKLIGALILFFVLYNLNFQFGLIQKIFNPVPKTESVSASTQAQIVSVSYSQLTDIVPRSFTFKKGESIRMEIMANDNGTGCMSTVMIPGLFQKPQTLIKGQKLIMEFTPALAGSYQITCAMGVPRGDINVID